MRQGLPVAGRAGPTKSPTPLPPRAPVEVATPLLTVHHERGKVAWAVRRLFVSDPARHRARVYAVEPARVTELVTISGFGDGVAGGIPTGVAIDPMRGRFYVADAQRNRVLALRVVAEGGAWRAERLWEAGGGAGGQALERPGGVDVDAEGRVYVADMGHARVVVLGPDGAFLHEIGGFGSAPGKLRSLIDVAVDAAAGLVYAVDALDRRVEVYGLGGAYRRTLAAGVFGGRLVLPSAAAVCPGGDLYVADFGGHRVHVVPAGGGAAGSWGEFGRTDGKLLGPTGIACDEKGTVAVLDTGARRVQLFGAGGKWRRTITLARIELPPRRVRDRSLGRPVVSPGATPPGQ